MTTTFITPSNPAVRVGPAAGGFAATANVIVASAARGLGVSLKLTGSGAPTAQAIPIGGFGTLTLLGAAAGILLAVSARRWVQHPAVGFVRLAVVGTVLSFVPDAISAADTATMLVLWTTHIVAAAIIVPPLTARLRVGATR